VSDCVCLCVLCHLAHVCVGIWQWDGTYADVYIQRHTFTCACIYIYIYYLCVYVHVGICLYLFINTHVCIDIYVCIRVNVRIYVHLYIHIYIHAYTYASELTLFFGMKI